MIAITEWIIRPTRFAALGYVKLAERCWRFVDIEQTRYNGNGNPSVTGAVYPTKTELLADLERFAREYGC